MDWGATPWQTRQQVSGSAQHLQLHQVRQSADDQHFRTRLSGHTLWRSYGPLHPGIYDPHPLAAVEANQSSSSIYHSDGATWIPGALYNVQALDFSAGKAFWVYAGPSISFGDGTQINCAACEGNPNALLFVAAMFVKDWDPHALGPWYTGTNTWVLFHEDKAPYIELASFFISVT
jgi:hypothetical protein